LTTTAKEELAKIVAICMEAILEQSKFEKSLTTDLKGVESTIKWLDGRRGNEPLTVETGRDIALHIRQAIKGNQVHAQDTHVLMLLLLKVALLAQRETVRNIEVLSDARKELESWFEQWKAANDAWNQYAE
jgi:hypothetical protein